MKRIVTILALMLACSAVSGQNTTLTLEQCKELARINDPYLKNARLDALAAKSQKKEAFAEYFPTVSASGLAFHALNPLIDIGVTDILGKSDAAWNISNMVDEAAYQNGLPSRYRTLQYGYGASISVTQPLFAGGRIVNGNRLASLGIRAADLKEGIRERETSEQVEEKYWLIVSLYEKEKTLHNAQELLDSLEKDVVSALEAGLVTESDRLQVSLKKSELKSASIQLAGGMKLAKMDLFNAIGVKYSVTRINADEEHPYLDDIRLADDLSGLGAPDRYRVPEEQMASAMEETELLNLQVTAKKLEKKMTLGSTLPQVAVGGVYGYGKYLVDGKANGGLFAMVSIPLSDWGKTASKLKRQDYEVEKAMNEKEYLDEQLLLRARQLWINLTTAWEQMAVAEEAVEMAGDSYRRQLVSYEAGLVTMSELLQTQTTLRTSEESLVEQKIAYRTALNSYLSLCRQ